MLCDKKLHNNLFMYTSRDNNRKKEKSQFQFLQLLLKSSRKGCINTCAAHFVLYSEGVNVDCFHTCSFTGRSSIISDTVAAGVVDMVQDTNTLISGLHTTQRCQYKQVIMYKP